MLSVKALTVPFVARVSILLDSNFPINLNSSVKLAFLSLQSIKFKILKGMNRGEWLWIS